jgi:hypothetical protein
MPAQHGTVNPVPTTIPQHAKPKTVRYQDRAWKRVGISCTYVDEVIIFLTSITDLQIVDEAIQMFEKASGARLNSKKSRALPIGRWKTFDTVRDIPYHPSQKILGVSFWNTIQTHLTAQVRSLARESYPRDLCLAHRIQYVYNYMLAKIWYAAQIFIVPSQTIHQLTTAVTYFIWKGAVFRVPVTVLRTSKTEGGWELIDIHAKCRALFLCRLHTQGNRSGTTTATWLRYWK